MAEVRRRTQAGQLGLAQMRTMPGVAVGEGLAVRVGRLGDSIRNAGVSQVAGRRVLTLDGQWSDNPSASSGSWTTGAILLPDPSASWLVTASYYGQLGFTDPEEDRVMPWTMTLADGEPGDSITRDEDRGIGARTVESVAAYEATGRVLGTIRTGTFYVSGVFHPVGMPNPDTLYASVTYQATRLA